MDATEPDGHVTLRLSRPEALALFDWIHRVEDRDARLDLLGIEDEAERRVLWALSASLEPVVSGVFGPDYAVLIEQDRRQVSDPE